MEICCTLLNGTLPTPETLSVRPVVELELVAEEEVELDEVDVDDPVEPEPPMLTLSTVPLT